MRKEIIAELLRQAADRIEEGSCTMTQEQMRAIFDELANEPMSKEQARKYLNMSRSNFDRLVAEGKLPAGRKVVGLTNLIWYKNELRAKRK